MVCGTRRLIAIASPVSVVTDRTKRDIREPPLDCGAGSVRTKFLKIPKANLGVNRTISSNNCCHPMQITTPPLFDKHSISVTGNYLQITCNSFMTSPSFSVCPVSGTKKLPSAMTYVSPFWHRIVPCWQCLTVAITAISAK